MTVIVVDDEGIVRDTLAMVLSNNGFDVRTAGSGQEGLQILAQTPAEFLITDFLMPNMNGAELLAEATRLHPGVKVILISGQVDCDDSMAKSARYAYATLRKPFDFRELMDLLAGPPTA